MKNCINIFCLFAFVSNIQSCIGNAYYKKLNGGYYLSAVDAREDMHLGYKDGDYGIGIVKETVFAVGQNEDFIIVKQHLRKFPNEPDKKTIYYFIIPLKIKINQSVEKNLYGPLTGVEFEEKRKQLNMANLGFTIVFKDL